MKNLRDAVLSQSPELSEETSQGFFAGSSFHSEFQLRMTDTIVLSILGLKYN